MFPDNQAETITEGVLTKTRLTKVKKKCHFTIRFVSFSVQLVIKRTYMSRDDDICAQSLPSNRVREVQRRRTKVQN